MKIVSVVTVCCLAMAAAGYSAARPANTQVSRSDQERQQEKVKISKQDLPDAAKKTLEDNSFRGWTITAVYKTKEGEYEVELKRVETTQVIKFDKDGKLK